MRQIQKGNERGLAGLYDESAPLIYGIALRMLRNPADAEEAAADVYSQVWRSAATWDQSRGTVSTWLVMLCRSRCIDRIRSRVNREMLENALEAETPVDDSFQWQREYVQQMLAQLEPEHRRLILAAFFEGLTHAELASKLGLPLGTVKTRIRAAVQQMRGLLKGYNS